MLSIIKSVFHILNFATGNFNKNIIDENNEYISKKGTKNFDLYLVKNTESNILRKKI